jgi:hypothetical protein
MAWCEANRIDFLFGLARNGRLVGEIKGEMAHARAESEASGEPARRFRDFAGSNPRFIVTSLNPAEVGARHLYEAIYCARGEMDTRIKECQLDLFADRTSAATRRANQLRQ